MIKLTIELDDIDYRNEISGKTDLEIDMNPEGWDSTRVVKLKIDGNDYLANKEELKQILTLIT